MKKYSWNEIILAVRKNNKEEQMGEGSANAIYCNVTINGTSNLDPNYLNTYVSPKTFFYAKFISDNQGRVSKEMEKVFDMYLTGKDRDIEIEKMKEAYGESWFLSVLRKSGSTFEDCIGINNPENRKYKQPLDESKRFIEAEPSSTGFTFEKLKNYYKTTYGMEDEKRVLAISNFVYNQANANLADGEKMKLIMFLHRPQVYRQTDNVITYNELKKSGGDYVAAYSKIATLKNIEKETKKPAPLTAIF